MSPLGLSWVQVDLPWACYGLGIDTAGVIVMAPPIAAWAIGRPERAVAAQLRRRGAVFTRVP